VSDRLLMNECDSLHLFSEGLGHCRSTASNVEVKNKWSHVSTSCIASEYAQEQHSNFLFTATANVNDSSLRFSHR
jgi:hypothetical protein